MGYQEHYINTLKYQRDQAIEQVAQLNAKVNSLTEEMSELKIRLENLARASAEAEDDR
ncbi:TPA: hypothetical protein U2L31_005515 [Burkholderia contaminans]|nr:hypothetical protein [Burkholderia contaminans]